MSEAWDKMESKLTGSELDSAGSAPGLRRGRVKSRGVRQGQRSTRGNGSIWGGVGTWWHRKKKIRV